MFRKTFTTWKKLEGEGPDHDSTPVDGGDSTSPQISPLTADSSRSFTASSIMDRSTRDPLGLKVVFRPLQERVADIVFVHGLGGSSRLTWSFDHNLDHFWPLELLPLEPEISDARIMTFGYNANFKPGSGLGTNSMSVLDFAKELLYDLKYAADESTPTLDDLRLGERPIVFVAHSMGGLIVKEAYMQGKDDPKYAHIIQAISSIIFMSTPHRGTNLAETLNRILKVSLVSGSMQFIAELNSGSQTLQKLNESFRHVAGKVQIISFYETRPTSMLRGASKIMVLEKESSVLGYPGEISKPLDADHHGVCKYKGPNDPCYVTVRNVLINLVANLRHTNTAAFHQTPQSSGSSFYLPTSARSVSTQQFPPEEYAPGTSPLTTTPDSARSNLDDYLASAESPNRDFNFFRDRWTAGTCEWVLSTEALASWLQDCRMIPRVLWLQGNAASGKSVMTSFIIDHLVRNGLPCFYFFLRFVDQKKRSLGTLLRSLAAQMSSVVPSYARSLLAIASATTDLKSADFRSIWQWFFKDTLFALNGDIEKPIYWVIDGLDEADTPSSLIRLLSDLESASIPLRILIASRKSHEISSAFVRLSKRLHLDTIWIEGSQPDLLAYIEQEMDFTEDHAYRNQAIAQLLERAKGNFLWLHLAVHKINTCHTKMDVDKALNDLPTGMQELYDRMALSVHNQSNVSDRRLGLKILGWATCAQRALSIEELRDALRSKDDIYEILEIYRTVEDLSGGFVVVDKEGKMALIHETAREYLTTVSFQDRPCAIDRQLTHDTLFRRCIACLSDRMLRGNISREQSPALLDYSISSWFIHLSLGSCADRNPVILDTVVGFLRSHHVLVWIFTAARRNALRILVFASRYLAGLVLNLRRFQHTGESFTQLQATEVIEGWATDLIKLVGKFGKSLIQSPDSIFRLIPPFCPIPSMLYQQFGHKECRVLSVSGIGTAKWDDCLARFSLESGAIASSVISKGSRVAILTISRRTSVIITYSDATFEEQRRLQHPERVFMIQMNTLGTLLVSYGYKTTRVWDPTTGDCIKIANNPSSRPRPQALIFVYDQVLVSSEDRCIRSLAVQDSSKVTWEPKSYVEEQGQVLEGTIASAPTCSAISHDGRMVAYGYRQHPVTIWELEPTTFRNQIELGSDREADMIELSSLKWHPLQPEIFCLSSVGILYKWDPTYDQAEASTHSGANTFNLNRNGSLVVTGDAVGTIKIFASADLSLLCQLSSQDNILNICFSSDSRRLYDMRSMYGIVWEPNTLVRLAEKSEYPESSTDILSETESLAKLSLNSEHVIARFDVITTVVGQSIGPLYCYGTEDGVVMLGEVGKGSFQELARSPSYMSIVHIVWSEDGRLVAFSDVGGRLLIKRVLRSSEGWAVQHAYDNIVPPLQGNITALVFHPSGTRLLAITPKTLHCLSIGSWGMIAEPCPIIEEPNIRWTSHPTRSDYILGFCPTKVHVLSWTSLREVAVKTYLPLRSFRPDPPPPTAETGIHYTHGNNSRAERGRLGRLISGTDSPYILLETTNLTAAGDLKREMLIFETADIDLSEADTTEGIASLRYTLVPDHVSARIREPLLFLPRRRLAYLDVDRWICTFRLLTLSPSLSSRRGSSIDQRNQSSIEAFSTHGGGLIAAANNNRETATRRRSDPIPGNTTGIEKYYFLPGDWVMANDSKICTMMPDGTFLCPQNGGISSVQSATLRK